MKNLKAELKLYNPAQKTKTQTHVYAAGYFSLKLLKCCAVKVKAMLSCHVRGSGNSLQPANVCN